MTTTTDPDVLSLINAFIRGFKSPSNLTPDLMQKVRRKAPMSTPSLSTQAAFYGVNLRTVSRWRKAGIDTTSPLAVGEYLLKLRHPSPSALFAIRDSLHEQIANSNQITK